MSEGEDENYESLNGLRWKYFSQTILPLRFRIWKAWTFVRTFLLAYVLVLSGQLVICALELDKEKQRREQHLYLQQRLKAELSNETYSSLLESGFKETNAEDPYAWDFYGVHHSRSIMLIATPLLVVTYLFAARKTLNFMRFLALLFDERNIRTFKKYDQDGSGQLNDSEFKVALNDLGYPVSEADVRMIMEEVNICDDELVTIEEFGQAMILLEYPDAKYQKARQTAFLVFVMALIWLLVGTLCFMHIESWTFVESMWFCWETSMTIGLGDLVPQTNTGRWFNIVYSFIGLGQLSLLLQTFVDLLTKHSSIIGRLENRFLEGKTATPTVKDVKTLTKKQKTAQKRIGILQTGLSPCVGQLSFQTRLVLGVFRKASVDFSPPRCPTPSARKRKVLARIARLQQQVSQVSVRQIRSLAMKFHRIQTIIGAEGPVK